MNFSSPEKVMQTIRAGDSVEYRRGTNREKITTAANGAPPMSDEEAHKLQQHINVNWGELASLLSHARRQYYNSFLRTENFFRVKLPDCKERTRAEYESHITTEINKPLKKSPRFFSLHQYRWTDVVVHGVASAIWEDSECWLPRFVAREDLRVPTDTESDLENLDWFGVRHLYTIGELVNSVWGDEADPHWKKKPIASILKNYRNVNYDTPLSYTDWETQPEKLAELVKQNLGYWESDAVPKVPLYAFYFRDTNRKWYKVVVPDTPSVRGESGIPEQFLWQSNDCECSHLSELLHCQFGDLSFKTPFMFHSIRSLGFELLEPTYWTNLTRCRFLQHVHENFNKWLQIQDPGNKERATSIEFNGPNVRIPAGVKIFSGNERHQIDPEMVEMALAQLKQLMQEASATYTQETDSGTQKEQTAFETGVKVQQVNAMLAGLMLVAFTRETGFDEEIARRFCIEKSSDHDVREFQRRCIQIHGIPRKWLNADRWQVEVDSPLGGGNPTMEQVEAQKAIEMRPLANPTAQGEMLHAAFTTFFGARRAARWAPIGKEVVIPTAAKQAQADFASLMWGVEVPIQPELNVIDQCDVLLRNLALVITKAKQSGVPSVAELGGMFNVAAHIAKLVNILAQNPAERARVRAFGQVLSNLGNQIKGFQQQITQAQKKAAQEQNGAGEAQLKAQEAQANTRMKAQESAVKTRSMAAEAGTKTRIAQQESQQKMQLANREFVADERRKNAKTANEIARSRLKSTSKE